MMKPFLKHFFLFTGLALATTVGLIFLSNAFVMRNTFGNWETESNLLVMKENRSYDVLIAGISHARNLSRHKNHLRLERITGKKILNIGRGGYYSGLVNQYVYLKYFYETGNTAGQVMVVLTPLLMYSYHYDNASNIFEDEPVSLRFIRFYCAEPHENKTQQIYYYLISKLTPEWFLTVPASLDSMTAKLDSVDWSKVEEGERAAYLDGTEQKVFENRKQVVQKIVDLCKKYGSRVTFMIPPALFGKWKGNDEVAAYLKSLKAEDPSIEWYDYSESVLEPKLYYDHHHLNSAGVEYFANHFLKNILH